MSSRSRRESCPASRPTRGTQVPDRRRHRRGAKQEAPGRGQPQGRRGAHASAPEASRRKAQRAAREHERGPQRTANARKRRPKGATGAGLRAQRGTVRDCTRGSKARGGGRYTTTGAPRSARTPSVSSGAHSDEPGLLLGHDRLIHDRLVDPSRTWARRGVAMLQASSGAAVRSTSALRPTLCLASRQLPLAPQGVSSGSSSSSPKRTPTCSAIASKGSARTRSPRSATRSSI